MSSSLMKKKKGQVLGQYVALFVSVFIDILIVKSLFNNPEYDYGVYGFRGN